MKNFLTLFALLAATPLAASAQSTADNIQQGGAAMVERQAAATRTSAAPSYSTSPSRAERKRTNARRKANNDAWEADKKAHGGTELRPGGYRWDPKTEQLIKPDGTYVAKKAQPPQKQATTNGQREIDPNNSLGKLQEFNRQEEERKKAAAKSAQ